MPYKNKEDNAASQSRYRQGHKQDEAERSRLWRAENKEYNNARLKAWRESNPAKYREQRWRRSGINCLTWERFLRLLDDQNYLCAICGTTVDISARPDHNHKTGEMRGILCRNCNISIGLFGDDPVRLHAAAYYLESWEGKAKEDCHGDSGGGAVNNAVA